MNWSFPCGKPVSKYVWNGLLRETTCHEREFARKACSDRGFETMRVAAKAMARTVADLLEDEALLADVRAEFSRGEPATL